MCAYVWTHTLKSQSVVFSVLILSPLVTLGMELRWLGLKTGTKGGDTHEALHVHCD